MTWTSTWRATGAFPILIGTLPFTTRVKNTRNVAERYHTSTTNAMDKSWSLVKPVSKIMTPSPMPESIS